MIDLVEMTVEQVQQGFLSGAFTCEALVQACLDRIARYNDHYNAIIFPNPAAPDDARAIDRRRAALPGYYDARGIESVPYDLEQSQN